MPVKNVQITVLIENSPNSSSPSLEAKHGLSVHVAATIDNNKVTVLMDTGPSPEKLLHNIKELNIILDDVNAIVLSHGHYDHTGGLTKVLDKMKKPVPVIGHPNLFNPKISIIPHLRLTGVNFKVSDLEKVGGVPLLASNPVQIADGITTTGEVPRKTNFEQIKGFWTINEKKFVDDLMLDDQALVIDVENKGLVVISGCGHSGIINTLKYAQQITGNKKIHGVIGGFHLIGANDEKIQTTINKLKTFNPAVVAPCHCTGKNPIKKFSEEFGDRFVSVNTGTVIKL